MAEESPQISDREREILKLVATGATNHQIAHNLDISINTVKVHLRNIFGKIGATSRTEATVYAIRQGLVGEEEKPVLDTSTLPPDKEPDKEEEPAFDRVQPTIAAEELPVAPLRPITASARVQSETENKNGASLVTYARDSHHAHSPNILLIGGLILVNVVLVILLVFVLLQKPSSQNTDSPSIPVNVSEMPTPVTEEKRWSFRTAMPFPRANFATVVYEYDAKIYVIGGNDINGPTATVQRYDPANDIWVSLTNKPTAVNHMQAAILNGNIYVPGGETGEGQVSDVLEVYNPRDQQWGALSSLPAPRSRYAIASFEGHLYLFGGWDGEQFCSEVFIYDPAADVWHEGPLLPTPRRDAGAAVVRGLIYVVGGENEKGALQVNEFYDPTRSEAGVWNSAVPLSEPIRSPAVVNVVNNLLVLDPQTHRMAQYNADTDSWIETIIPTEIALSNQAVVVDGSIFFFGRSGRNKETASLSEYRAFYKTFLPGLFGP